MKLGKAGRVGVALSFLGIAGVLFMQWQVFFWVSTDAAQGIVQRIFYVHVPAAWVAEMAFGITALASCAYLWLEDERADAAAVAAAEGGLFFGALLLVAGPLWGSIAWGTAWAWEPRLTLTLLLWFIFLGYFLVRGSIDDQRKAKKLAAVVAIVGALDIPLIHVSVNWFRSLHPKPVVLNPDGPTLPADMLQTLLVGFLGFTILFFGLFLIRYSVELAGRQIKPQTDRPNLKGAVI